LGSSGEADERLPGEYPVRDIVAEDMGKLFKDLVEQETTRRLRSCERVMG